MSNTQLSNRRVQHTSGQMSTSFLQPNGTLTAGAATPPPPAANIRVYVRVRPLNDREKESAAGSNSCLSADPSRRTIDFHAKPEAKQFQYDHVADANATQEDVFQKVGKPITESCLAGYNGTIFAYGQTGSGKSYTIQGKLDDKSSSSAATSSITQPQSEFRGLMPRVFEYLMSSIAREERKASSASGIKTTYTCHVSFLEIYNERIFDLLDPSSSHTTTGGGNGGHLQLREDTTRGVFVDGLSEELVRSVQDCNELMMKGALARRVGETALNRESSRSHSVFSLNIRSTTTSNGRTIEKHAKFNLIDLAGSERAKETKAQGAQMTEAKNINKSLSALGNVIRELMKRTQVNKDKDAEATHVPYRDSKLTFLLRDSLGGNSLTYLIACVSSASSSFFESLSTLKFATMASAVKNCAKVNEDVNASMEALREENETLKANLARMMASQQLSARRMSMMPAAGFNPRESLCFSGGLMTPNRLRRGSMFGGVVGGGLLSKTPTHKMITSIAEFETPSKADFMQPQPEEESDNASLIRMTQLFEASHAREQAWLDEIHQYQSQLSIMAAKQRHDGWLLRVKDSQLSLNKKGIASYGPSMDEKLAEENSLLRDELSALKSYGSEVTHAPSLLDAHKQIRMLRELLKENGIPVPTAAQVKAEDATPKHQKEFAYQTELLELQAEVERLTTDLVLSQEKAMVAGEEAEQKLQERLTNLESSLESEKGMVTHLESEINHLLEDGHQKQRGLEEVVLMKQGLILRLENEMADLERTVKEMEERIAAELQSVAQKTQLEFENHQVEQQGLTQRFMFELETMKEKYECMKALVKEKDESLFQTQQAEKLLCKQKCDLFNDLTQARTKINTLEGEMKSLQESAANDVKILKEQVDELTMKLDSTNNELTSSQSAHSSLQSEYSTLSSRFSELESSSEKLNFKFENLQDDHDTLSQEFEFISEADLKLKEELSVMEKELIEKSHHITIIEGKLNERDVTILQLRDSLTATLEQDQSQMAEIEVRCLQLAKEKMAVESKLEEVQAELDEITIKLNDTNTAFLESQASVVELTVELNESRSIVDELKLVVQDVTMKHAGLNSDVQSLSDDLLFTQTNLSELTNTHETLQAKYEEQSHSLESKNEELTEVYMKLSDLSSQLKTAHQEREELQSSKDELFESFTLAQSSLASISSELSTLREAHESLSTKCEHLTSSLTRLTEEKAAIETKLSDIINMAASLGTSVAAEEAAKKEAKEEVERSQKEKDELMKQLAITQQEVIAIKATNEKVAHNFQQLQQTLTGLETLRQEREAELSTARIHLMSMKEDMVRLTHERDHFSTQFNEQVFTIANLQDEISQLQHKVELGSQDSAIALSLQSELQSVQQELMALRDRHELTMKERDVWMSEMETVRREELQQIELITALKQQVHQKEELLATQTEKMKELSSKNHTLEETNGQLIGHQNQKQKIQLHQQIKKENDQLRVEKANLEREVKKFRKLYQVHAAGSNGTAGMIPSLSAGALEKELSQADEHIRAGEQAQLQLQTIMDKIGVLEMKVKQEMSSHTAEPNANKVLGDITNQMNHPTDSTHPVEVVKSHQMDGGVNPPSSFPHCLSTLTNLSTTFIRLSSQLDLSRREANMMRNQLKLHQMKHQLTQEKSSTTTPPIMNGYHMRSGDANEFPITNSLNDQENQ